MFQILEGIILDVSSSEYTCHVRAHSVDGNAYDLEDVPLLSRSISPDIWTGDTNIPERLSACLVLMMDAQSYVLDIVPASRNRDTNPPKTDPNKSITLTEPVPGLLHDYVPASHKTLPGRNKSAERKFLLSARTNRPHDALPGDKFWKTREGSFFGILRGGVILAKVHEFCQIMLSRIDGLCRVVSRNVQLFTDWGRIDITNDKNNTNMALHIGENYANNKQEKFTIHLDVGSVGNLIHLRVTDAEGTQMARVQVYPNGRVELDSKHSIYVTRGGSVVDLNESGEVFIKSEGKLYIN